MAPNEDEVERQLTTLTGSSTGSSLPFLCHLRRSTVLLIPGAVDGYISVAGRQALFLSSAPDAAERLHAPRAGQDTGHSTKTHEILHVLPHLRRPKLDCRPVRQPKLD